MKFLTTFQALLLQPKATKSVSGLWSGGGKKWRGILTAFTLELVEFNSGTRLGRLGGLDDVWCRKKMS